MPPDQNPEEIVVDFNFKEIQNNETAEEVKAKPKRASRKNIVVEQVEPVEQVEKHTEVKQQVEPVEKRVEKQVEKQIEKPIQKIQMEFQRKKEEPKKRHIWFS